MAGNCPESVSRLRLFFLGHCALRLVLGYCSLNFAGVTDRICPPGQFRSFFAEMRCRSVLFAAAGANRCVSDGAAQHGRESASRSLFWDRSRLAGPDCGILAAWSL